MLHLLFTTGTDPIPQIFVLFSTKIIPILMGIIFMAYILGTAFQIKNYFTTEAIEKQVHIKRIVIMTIVLLGVEIFLPILTYVLAPMFIS